MIRHSSSFLFSIVFHIVLFSSLFYVYNLNYKKKDVQCEKKVCVKLCDIELKKEIKAPPIKPKPKPQIKPKTQPKPKEKPKKQEVKEIQKTKPKPKKEIPVKKEIKVIEEQKPQEEIQKKPEEKVVEEKVVEKVVPKIQESVPSPEDISREYMQDNIAMIVKLLQDNLYYPRIARKKNITGIVVVKFTLGIDSSTSDIAIVESKHKILSRSAIKTIEDLSGEFPKPKEELTLQVPINYTLN